MWQGQVAGVRDGNDDGQRSSPSNASSLQSLLVDLEVEADACSSASSDGCGYPRPKPTSSHQGTATLATELVERAKEVSSILQSSTSSRTAAQIEEKKALNSRALLQFIRTVPFFSGTRREISKAAAHQLELVQREAGAVLFQDGNAPSGAIHILLSGIAHWRDEGNNIIRPLRLCEALGDIRLLQAQGYPEERQALVGPPSQGACACAVTDVQLAALPLEGPLFTRLREAIQGAADFCAAVKASEHPPLQRTLTEVRTIARYLRQHETFQSLPQEA
eukprot:CAMPEP_0180540406 /NCGR_PEP_ID=MMETSP1036_2-20121128/67396_1 /TAXON_ID=632150 /ORGANISM="Azadinium spinosum, Strain 3D9" /LENGTH=276 /DNA_ID=CAMNT_0022555193 /DNA_START=94 /DNA_END=920 /DNA_ORIENTATION=+